MARSTINPALPAVDAKAAAQNTRAPNLSRPASRWHAGQVEAFKSSVEELNDYATDVIIGTSERLARGRPPEDAPVSDIYQYLFSSGSIFQASYQEVLKKFSKRAQDFKRGYVITAHREHPTEYEKLVGAIELELESIEIAFESDIIEITVQISKSFFEGAEYHINNERNIDLVTKLLQLNSFVEENYSPRGDVNFLEKIESIFPEHVASYKDAATVQLVPPFPKVKAPKSLDAVVTQSAPKWAHREAGDTPVSFVKRHYGVWRDGVWDRNGLTKPDLRRSDLQLYNALANWERRHPEDQLGLPTLKEENDLWIERVQSGAAPIPTNVLEHERLRNAMSRRKGGSDVGRE